MANHNPIIFNSYRRAFLDCFSHSFVSKIKSGLKDTARDSYGGGISYNEKTDMFTDLVEVFDSKTLTTTVDQTTRPLSSYVEEELHARGKKLTDMLISFILNPSANFARERTLEFDITVREAAKAVEALQLSGDMKTIYENMIAGLYKKSESIFKQLRIERSNSDKKYWKQFFGQTDTIKVFKTNLTSENWVRSIAAALPDGCISPTEYLKFFALFNATGLLENKPEPIRWYYRNPNIGNGKEDKGALIALLYLLIDNDLIAGDWKSAKELSSRIEALFCTEDGVPIKVEASSISKNRNQGAKKFPKLYQLLQSRPFSHFKEKSKENNLPQ